jgi:methylenetetrahydrofolate--tRNA-(uracil-5-)-methyltransferase
MSKDSKNTQEKSPVHIIGGGLAGCEAAWQLARHNVPVILHEMRPIVKTNAHQSETLAELVCSNSFRSDDHSANAVGVLHEEMRRAGSLIMSAADNNKVPAGSALAVDREHFANHVAQAIESNPMIEVKREEVKGLPDEDWGKCIIATGPLTSDNLAKAISEKTGEESLDFFDAIAPIIHFDSIDMDKAWFQSRYDKVGPDGDGKDYINCPLDETTYNAFMDALIEGEKTEFKEWEDTPYFDGCLPIEIMAERGRETLRHGPMKPMGLTNVHQPDIKAYAVVQLRQDNKLGTLYNMVGFQTKLKYGAQKEIFQMIPGLENAEFARLGGLHRNTFLNSPKFLSETLQLKAQPNLRFAGQITGCEGYVESSAIGLLTGLFTAYEILGRELPAPPETTAFGALLSHITTGHISYDQPDKSARSFQPMNINFGLFPPLPEGAIVRPEGLKRFRGKDKARAKKLAQCQRALNDFDDWVKANLD